MPAPCSRARKFRIAGPAGVLHVRRGEQLVRISVGGPYDEQTKLEKCTTIARLVLNRL